MHTATTCFQLDRSAPLSRHFFQPTLEQRNELTSAAYLLRLRIRLSREARLATASKGGL